MKHENLLNDMYCFYARNPEKRGVVKNHLNEVVGCRYRGDNGTMCAIGRHIPDDLYVTRMDVPDDSGVCILLQHIIDMVPFLQQFRYDFLATLQSFHDQPLYWDKHEPYYNIDSRIERYNELLELAQRYDEEDNVDKKVQASPN